MKPAQKYWKHFIWLIVAALLIVGGRAAYADYQTALQRKVISPNYWEPTRADLRVAMRFHGISFSEEGSNHQWYFWRDKKRCSLFGYLKTVKRKA